MMKFKTTAPLILAGLLAGVGAHAQSSVSATSDVPVKAGEASTVTRGQPNMAPSNSVAIDPASSTATMGAAPAPAQVDPVVIVPAAPVVVAPAVPADTATLGAGRVVPRDGASVTSNVPTKAGEASTMTNGVPNVSTNNPVTNDGRAVYPRANEVATVPMQAGEASTMVNGRPNWNPDDPVIQRRGSRVQ